MILISVDIFREHPYYPCSIQFTVKKLTIPGFDREQD